MLTLRGLTKSYSGVEVLHALDLDGQPGEVVAIAGANGAGKSTLIKILSGAVSRDAGEIFINGEPVRLASPREAQELGIRTVYQELSIVSHLSVTENVLLGDLPSRYGLVDWPAAHARCRALLDGTGFVGIDPHDSAGQLSVARRQMVEITKAVATAPRILILDEPSAILAGADLDRLFTVIESLRATGVLVLYVSHRLEEVMRIADRIVVLKDGHLVATTTPAETDETELVRLMAGRRLDQLYPPRRTGVGQELLAVDGLTRSGAFADVSFRICAGEVVGMFGLVGSGRTEVAECLFGAARPTAGTLRVDGRKIRLRSPKDAITAGIALVTEDRKGSGLVLGMSIRDNAALATLGTFAYCGLINRKRQTAAISHLVQTLAIVPPGLERPVAQLSGGNQQKVVLTKWLLSKPRLLILDEPTRGVDVATRIDLYRMFDALTRDGIGILLISSDLTEVLGATDRTLVMRAGRLVADLRSEEVDEEYVLARSVIGAAA